MRLMQNFRNNETGEIHYEPVKLNLYSVIRRFFAWKRIWIWGFCPGCNSDAPKLYDCKVCNYDTTSPFNRAKRKEYWNNWKLQDFINAMNEAINYTHCCKSDSKHKAKVLTKEEVEKNRSNAYKYLDL